MKNANLLADLDKMVKRASAVKAEALKAATTKQASIGDNADDHTAPAATGAQAAANAAAGKDRVEAASVDKAAPENKPNDSIKNQASDGATAAATDGQAGAKGAVLSVAKTEPLVTDGAMKTATDLVAELRKAAAAAKVTEVKPEITAKPVEKKDKTEKKAEATENKVDESIKNSPSEGVTAAATDGQAGAKGSELPVTKTEGVQGGAEAEKAADKVEQKTAGIRGFLAKVALAVPQVKAAAEAEQMSEEQVGDAAAENLVQQIESGQLSEEEAQKVLDEALQSGAITEQDLMEALEGAEGAEGAEGDLAAAGAPAVDPAAAPQLSPEDQMKVASVGPEHPAYLEKLSAFYGDAEQAGYQFGLKLAADLAAEAEAAEEKAEKAEDKALKATVTAHEVEKKIDEKAPEGDIVAVTPEEKAALAEAQKELGISEADLAALAATPVAKTASLKNKYVAAILNKVAHIQAAK